MLTLDAYREMFEKLEDTMIVSMVAGEGLGITTVANRLNAAGVRPPGRARQWHPKMVWHVFGRATGMTVSQYRAT